MVNDHQSKKTSTQIQDQNSTPCTLPQIRWKCIETENSTRGIVVTCHEARGHRKQADPASKGSILSSYLTTQALNTSKCKTLNTQPMCSALLPDKVPCLPRTPDSSQCEALAPLRLCKWYSQGHKTCKGLRYPWTYTAAGASASFHS